MRTTRASATAVALALVAALAGAVPAGAAEAAPIVLRGGTDSFVDTQLPNDITLGEVTDFVEGGRGGDRVTSTSLGSGSGSYLGWYVLSLPDLRPVTGYVQVRAFDEEFGEPVTVRLVESPATVLPAGRYRFILLTDGTGEARISTTNLTAPLALSTTTPHPTAGGSARSVVSSALPERSGPVEYRLETGSVYIVGQQRVVPAPGGAGAIRRCAERRDAGPCDMSLGDSSFPINAGSVSFRTFFNTDFDRPGIWDSSWESSGAQRLDVFALAVGPGPRPVPVLPTAEAGLADGTAQSRARNTAESCPQGAVPPTLFSDTGDTVHAAAIDCLAWYGIVRGAGNEYRPGQQMTRGQMASMLVRMLVRAGVTAPQNPPDAFDDDTGSPHESAINTLAAVGVVSGFGDGSYRPAAPVPRDQMATFLHRAFAVGAGTPLRPVAAFADVRGNTHEANIQALASNGIAQGWNDAQYAPAETVTRAQIASFIARTLDLLTEIGRTSPP